MKRFFVVLLLTVCIAILLSSNKLFSDEMYSFHDQTQAARISDFSFAIKNGQIPPRMAHHFSNGMGYPIFNYYAPTSYFITSDFYLLGLSIPDAIKLSFTFAVLVLGISTFFLFRGYFSEMAAFFGAFLITSSPFIALEIFVRGNLAELWFLALFPLVLFLVRTVSINRSKLVFVSLVCVFSLFLTAHNALSILGAGIVLSFVYFHQNKKRVYTALLLGLVLSSYFFLPAFGELGLTHAREVASSTHYQEHFVCMRQLWSSLWGFGGSVHGCVDGMSFMLGKLLILAGLAGGLLWMTKVSKKNFFQDKKILFFAFLGFIGIFLSLAYSSFIWIIFEPFLQLFQFPWRFLGIALFGLGYLAAYSINCIPSRKIQLIISLVCILLVLGTHRKYFSPNPQKIWSEMDFEKMFISQQYLYNDVAGRVPEYFPEVVDLKTIVTQEKPVMDFIISPTDGGSVDESEHSIFSYEVRTTSKSFYINKHYMPNWVITVNQNRFIPKEFDSFGRPKVAFSHSHAVNHVTIAYVQTPLEKFANVLSLSGIIVLGMCLHPKLWKKLSH